MKRYRNTPLLDVAPMVCITDGRTPKTRTCQVHRDPYAGCDDAPSMCGRDGGNDQPGPVMSERQLDAARNWAPLTRGVCPVHGDQLGLKFANGEEVCYECGRTLTGGPS